MRHCSFLALTFCLASSAISQPIPADSEQTRKKLEEEIRLRLAEPQLSASGLSAQIAVITTGNPANPIVLTRVNVPGGGGLRGDPESINELLRRYKFQPGTIVEQINELTLLVPDVQAVLARQEGVQSVNPSAIQDKMEKLPLLWRAEAALNGMHDFSPQFPPACPGSQNAFYEQIELRFRQKGWLESQDTPEQKQRLSNVVRAFDQDCLAPVTAQSINPFPVDLFERTSVITKRNGLAFCMAVHLGGSYFLTARHCLLPRSGSAEEVESLTISLLTQATMGGYAFSIVTDAPLPPAFSSYSASADMLLLKASGLPETLSRKPVVPIGGGGVGAESHLIGNFMLAEVEKLISPTGLMTAVEAGRWVQNLRRTRGDGDGYCRVYDRSAVSSNDPACLIHACQAMGGFSGGALWTKGADGWSLSGIQSVPASASELSRCRGLVSNRPTGALSGEGSIAARVPADLGPYLTQRILAERGTISLASRTGGE